MPSEAGFFSSTLNTLSRVGGSPAGSAFKQGVLETFGWSFDAGKIPGLGKKINTNYGFMGLGKPKIYGSLPNIDPGVVAKREAAFAGKWAKKSFMGKLGKRAMGGLGIAATAWGVYQGYQEGGVFGAAKEVGSQAIGWGILRAATVALSGWATPIAGAAALAYGGYQFGEAAGRYANKMRNIEMGAPLIDPYGTIATTRQRSLMALQNTHINGRMALGNEGLLMHDNAYSNFRR
jgi:hypothetical protein